MIGLGLSITHLAVRRQVASGGTPTPTPTPTPIPTPTLTPTADWRLPVTEVYDSTGVSQATFRTALLAAHTSKALPDPATPGVASNTTRHFALKTDPVAAPGGILSFVASYNNDTNQSFEVWESFDSADGSPGSGTWTKNPFTIRGVSEGGGKGTNRAQIIQLASGAARWVRLVLINGGTSSMALGTEYRAHQLKADGSHDLWASVGMSISRANMTRALFRSLVRSLKADADPLLLDLHRSGANANQMLSEMITPVTTDAQFAGVANVLFDGGPNDTAYASVRPYTGKQADIDVGDRFVRNLTLLQAKFGAEHVFATNISFMNALMGDNSAGTAPYVNNVVDSANGTLPYNIAYINPALKQASPVSWDAGLDMPIVDDYWGTVSTLVPQAYPNDPLHGGNPDWYLRRKNFIRKAYKIAVVPADNTANVLLSEIGAKNTAAKKAILRTLITNAVMPSSDPAVVSNRQAYLAQVDSIVTAFADPALVDGAILPGAMATATPVIHLDASQFELISRRWNGIIGSVTDRVGAYPFAPTGSNLNPSSVPESFSGAKAALKFDIYAAHLANSNAALRSILDAANPTWTLFFVVTVTKGARAGYGSNLFSIGGATNQRLNVGIGTRAGVTVGDATGVTSFGPADPEIALGVRYACMFRQSADGTLSYQRGAVASSLANTRTAAITSSRITNIGRRFDADGNSTFQDDLHELVLATGAVSDAEAAKVLDGLRQKWTGGGVACL